MRIQPLLFAILLSACASPNPAPSGPVTTPSSGTPQPAAEVRFNLAAPPGTPADAEIVFVLLDSVTGLELNAQRIPMQAQSDGTWSLSMAPAAGSLLYYRYERSSPEGAIEVTAQGKPVDYRTAYLPGPGEIHDRVSRWSGEPFRGETGRLLGQILSAEDGQPLNEMVISAGGQLTFTDGEGRFRIDDLSPGLHTLTAFSPTGSYLPRKQDALIAANTSTPAELSLEAAQPVLVTFQVSVPEDTPEQAVLRIAGNLAQLGFRYKTSRYGSYQSISKMPALVRVDPRNYLGVFTLYQGTHLQYKYTLGDGVWNAERSSNGSFTTRTITVEGENPTLRDQVASWSDSTAEPTRFEVAVPEETPTGDAVAIQFKVGSWRTPLPMWPKESLWTFALYGPESLQQEMDYRFCRNLQCGAADEAEYAGPDASGRQLDSGSRGTLLQNVVDGWQWLDGSALNRVDQSSIPTLEHIAEGGYELSNLFDPSWTEFAPATFGRLADTGANELILSPAWIWAQKDPFPVLEFDPTKAAFEQELEALIQAARSSGFRVTLRPTLQTPEAHQADWWQQASRSQLWWDLWFEEYRSFVLTYALLAQQNGVEKLIIGGPEVIPALPFGSLPDGSPSGVPADSELRWRRLIGEIKQRFAGQLAFELEVGDELSLVPPFMDEIDRVHLYWHSPLGEVGSGSQDVAQAEIEARLNDVLDENLLEDKPVSISLAYLSLQGSAAACAPLPDGSCRPLSDFDRGQVVDIDLNVDLEAQAQVFAAYLQAIADERQVQGLFARGFYPAVILHDKSLSVYGKPAQQILAVGFSGLRGP